MLQDQGSYFCLKYRRPLTTAAIPEEASNGSRRYDTKVSRAEAMALKGLGTLGRDGSRAVVSRSSHTVRVDRPGLCKDSVRAVWWSKSSRCESMMGGFLRRGGSVWYGPV
jgi:hypothetical protein